MCGIIATKSRENMNSKSINKILTYIARWEKQGYPNGIPDEAPPTLEDNRRVPSYRLICAAILKNDHTLQLLGFSRPPCEIYNQIKRDEIRARYE